MNKVPLEEVYRELRTAARRLLRHEPYHHTLESCELVHLAWARLLGGELERLTLDTPEDVLRLAITNMRRELIDHARRRRAAKRPDAKIRVDLDDAPLMCFEAPETLLAVDELLQRLKTDPAIRNGQRKSTHARYALYGGLVEAEIAQLTGSPKSTVGNDLRFARAWLAANLTDDNLL